jgi:hypothetical protein
VADLHPAFRNADQLPLETFVVGRVGMTTEGRMTATVCAA